MDKAIDTALVWFRRDLRVNDHAALYHALRAARRVYTVFIFDRDILDPLLERGLKADRRVEFIRDSVVDLDSQLRALGQAQGVANASVIVRHARALDEIPRLAAELHAQAVYANHDDEPYALTRDALVRGRLSEAGIALHTSKDHVVFERNEVLSPSETAFSVFTSYEAAWLKKLEPFYLSAYPVAKYAASLASLPEHLRGVAPALAALGFEPTNLPQLKITAGSAGGLQLVGDFLQRIDRYDETRNFPAQKGPSYLSVHLRFGTVSIRHVVREAQRLACMDSKGARAWRSALIRRDFYHQILHHHPRVVESCFKTELDAVRWEQGKKAIQLYKAWCEGRTGYPLVDAAMAQINETGYMHSRLRMLVASFLVKDLGIDWRWGERYFADRSNDFDLAVNNGGWQWAAGTGCDAHPYFRVFNPVAQSEKFDPGGKFIRRYLPQLARLPDTLIHAPWLARPVDLASAGVALGQNYPVPLVQHEAARVRALERFAAVKEARR